MPVFHSAMGDGNDSVGLGVVIGKTLFLHELGELNAYLSVLEGLTFASL